MKKQKEFFTVPTKEEYEICQKDYGIKESIENIRLLKTKGMKEFCWEAIAIKLDNPKDIKRIVELKADEYLGEHEGFHVFWWD